MIFRFGQNTVSVYLNFTQKCEFSVFMSAVTKLGGLPTAKNSKRNAFLVSEIEEEDDFELVVTANKFLSSLI